MVREIIAEGSVRVIGGTTPDAQRRYLATDAGLFETMPVGEPAAEEAAAIVAAAAPGLAATHGVTIGTDAIDAAAAKSDLDATVAELAHPGDDKQFEKLLDDRAWSQARLKLVNS